MKESGLRPYNWTGLSYNAWRNVVPKRRLEWLGYEVVHLEKKKPNQHFVKMKNGDTNFSSGAAQYSDYSDMIYTNDAQCMQSRYPTARYEKNIPEYSFPPWTPPVVEIPTEEIPAAPTAATGTWSDDFNAAAIDTNKWLASNPAPIISDGHLSADSTDIVGVSSYAIWESSFSISIKIDRADYDTWGDIGFLIDSYPYSGDTVSYYVVYWPDQFTVELSTGEHEMSASASWSAYLKIERSGSNFTFSHSTDGSSYETLATKSLFAGNVGISLFFNHYNYPTPPDLTKIDSFEIQSGEPGATPKAEAGSLYWGQ